MNASRDLSPRGNFGGQRPVGLYVHIPFCRSRCSYCDFYSTASPGGAPDGFIRLLCDEARLYDEEPPIEVDTIYVGGGTPTTLTPPQISHLREGLACSFDLSGLREATLEANPESLDVEKLEAWLAAGFNRISIGVQSFQSGEAKTLSRLPAPEECLRAVHASAAAGFRNISVDLMGGIPGQTTSTLESTLSMASDLPMSHLSFYILDLHPGTRLYSDVLSGTAGLPGEDEIAKLYEFAHEFLVGRGFEHYEISNFARGGARCLHNLKYWRGEDYVGLGPSAHGRFRGYMTANAPSIENWTSVVESGAFVQDSARVITKEMAAEDRLIFGLRLSDGVSFEAIESLEELQGEPLREKIQRLVAGGQMEVDGDRLRLTPTGFLVSSEVISYLLPDRWRS